MLSLRGLINPHSCLSLFYCDRNTILTLISRCEKYIIKLRLDTLRCEISIKIKINKAKFSFERITNYKYFITIYQR